MRRSAEAEMTRVSKAAGLLLTRASGSHGGLQPSFGKSKCPEKITFTPYLRPLWSRICYKSGHGRDEGAPDEVQVRRGEEVAEERGGGEDEESYQATFERVAVLKVAKPSGE